ncbi:MAG: DUF896 domain-containing protein [Firmicutes bacterium]|nr:DUF896 domain-containing protein [Bacillota bacterium]
MITKEMIDRINQLSHKKKTVGLTEEEKAEQMVLYREYIDAFKQNLKAQLDAIEIVDDTQTEVVELETVEIVEDDGADN